MASMLQALQPHPEDRLHLRLHRARSVVLTSEELVEIRAAQRTFEGAYMRTALSQFSFSLVVLKIFTSEFYPIGALLASYGACVLAVAVYRRYEGNRQFFDREEEASEEEEGSSFEDDEEGGDDEDGGGEGEGTGVERERERGRRRVCAYQRGYGNGNRNGNGRERHAVAVVVKKKFRTSGNSVGLLVGLSMVSYVALVVLLWKLVE